MPIAKTALKKQLKKKFGFVAVEATNHDTFSLYHDGKKIATTRFSRGSKSKDISDNLLRVIASQLHVKLNYLKRMHGCTRSCDQYLEQLKEHGYLD